MASFLNDKFLQEIANSAGQSNSVTVSNDNRTLVKDAIAQIEEELRVPNVRGTAARPKPAPSGLYRLRDQLKVAIAPHKVLLPDILLQIFSEFEEGYIEIVAWEEYWPRHLRQICSGWRQIALRCHSLWSGMDISWPEVVQVGGRNQVLSWNATVSKARHILPPVGSIGLRIMTERIGQLSYSKVSAEVNPVSSLIVPFAQRLVALYLQCNHEELYRLFAISNQEFPALEQLVLISPDMSTSPVADIRLPAEAHFMSALRHASLLQEIDIEIGPYQPMVVDALKVHAWPNLSLLSLAKPISTDILFPLLRHLNQLEELSVSINQECSTQLKAVVHDLSKLDVRLMGPSEEVLDFLTLPSLFSLDIEAFQETAVPKLINLIERSECVITSITQRWEDPSMCREYRVLLEKMPELRELYTETEFELPLFHDIGSGALLPHLEILKYESSLSTIPVADALESGLRSRVPDAPHPPRLREIRHVQTSGYGDEVHREAVVQRMDHMQREYNILIKHIHVNDLQAPS